MEHDEETGTSEITILPDGRVFVLGATRQVLEVLEVLSPADAALKQRLNKADETEESSHREVLEGPLRSGGHIA